MHRRPPGGDRVRLQLFEQHEGGRGLVWTEPNLYDHLRDPCAFLKKTLDADGVRSKMLDRVPKVAPRRDVVTFLKAEACE